MKVELQRIERAAMQSLDPKDRMKYASSTTKTTIATPSKRAFDYYVDPTVPTIEELREQAENEKKAAVQGNEAWAVKKEIAQVGEWETVEASPLPLPVVQQQKEFVKDSSGSMHDQAPQFQDDDEDDQEDLHSFKIKEKELQVPISDDTQEEAQVTFKKRKLGDSGIKSRKKKPLRKKE